MASSAKHLSLLFLLTLFFSLQIDARESKFFNKIPSNNVVKEEVDTFSKQEEDPSFVPENENAYGLYGHESGQLPPTGGAPYKTTNNNLPYKTESGEPLNKFLPDNYNPVAYVTKPRGYNGGNGYTVQKQGMSDTRFMENGKYYYDPKKEKYDPNVYENSMGVGSRNEYNNNKGYYGNNENSYESNNSLGGYQTQGEYPDPDPESQEEFIP